MKNIVLKFGFLFALLFVVSSVPQAEASGTRSSTPCYLLLRPGEKVWGTYNCASCGEQTSAKKKSNGRQTCNHCGVPHTNEDYSPPHHVVRDGKTYVLADAPIQLRDGSEGNHWSCPFCESSNFIDVSRCGGCGSEVDLSDPNLKRVGDEGRHVDPSESPDANGNFAVDSSRRSRSRSAQMAQVVSNVIETSRAQGISEIALASLEADRTPLLSRVPKTVRNIVAAALISGAMGYVWWGTQTDAHMGQVTEIHGDTVIVQYQDDDEFRSVSLQMLEDSSGTDWQVGDQVEVHTRNWSGPVGAEGPDGSILDPQ